MDVIQIGEKVVIQSRNNRLMVHWRKIRTANDIEQAFREVRRRTRLMNCFRNPAYVDLIDNGVISYLNKTW
jgi:transposase-like protein